MFLCLFGGFLVFTSRPTPVINESIPALVTFLSVFSHHQRETFTITFAADHRLYKSKISNGLALK